MWLVYENRIFTGYNMVSVFKSLIRTNVPDTVSGFFSEKALSILYNISNNQCDSILIYIWY